MKEKVADVKDEIYDAKEKLFDYETQYNNALEAYKHYE